MSGAHRNTYPKVRICIQMDINCLIKDGASWCCKAHTDKSGMRVQGEP
uniref:Uncharacterized protein n=1 Tax=Arundo donax TaxID=35708 RepID=A0A0A9BDT5_ARUDO